MLILTLFLWLAYTLGSLLFTFQALSEHNDIFALILEP